MGSVLIFVCGRCGDPHPGPRWFTNKRQEDCHYCRDGTIGGRIEHDAARQPQPAPEAGDDIVELARKIRKEMARHG